jgi:hypothetical protein
MDELILFMAKVALIALPLIWLLTHLEDSHS